MDTSRQKQRSGNTCSVAIGDGPTTRESLANHYILGQHVRCRISSRDNMIAQCLQNIIDIFSWINSRWRRTFVNSMITWNCGSSGGQDCNNILRNSRHSIDCALLVKYRRCHGQCIQVKDFVFPDESFLGLQGPHVLSKTCPPAPKEKLDHLFIGKCALDSSEDPAYPI